MKGVSCKGCAGFSPPSLDGSVADGVRVRTQTDWRSRKLTTEVFRMHLRLCDRVSFLLFRRIAVIFQVRSAKTVKITDTDLLKKLGIIVLVFSTFLTIRTLVAPPNIKVGITADNLKAYLCETNWWDRWFSFSKYLNALLKRVF